MKESYAKPRMEILEIEQENVILTSGGYNPDNEGEAYPQGEGSGYGF